MKTRRIHMIAKQWLAAIVLLVLMSWVGIAEANSSLDKQLIEAAGRGDLVLVKSLIANGANVNARDESGWRPLLSAADGGKLEIVKFLIDKGAGVNARDSSGRSPLAIAASHNNREVAEALIDRGADVNALDQSGRTVLAYAIHGSHMEPNRLLDFTKLLVEKGADVNEVDRGGATPLMAAANYGLLNLVVFFIEKGANVNAVTETGRTALMAAASTGNLELVKFLAERGADVNVANRAGETALSLAEYYGRKKVIQYLQARVAVQAKPSDSLEARVEYPSSPHGVMEAFVKVNLLDRPSRNTNKVRPCEFELARPHFDYRPEKEEIETNYKTPSEDRFELGGPEFSEWHIATGFEIKEIKEVGQKAIVKVLYRRLGWISLVPIEITECRSDCSAKNEKRKEGPGLLETVIKMAGEREGRVWDEKGCRILHISDDTQEVVYHLAKPGRFWRLTGYYQPYISVQSAIRVLECAMAEGAGTIKRYPSEQQRREITQVTKTLEKHLSK